MGTALSVALSSRQYRVITTFEGRSPRTRDLCQNAALESRASLRDVVAESDILMSVVTPGSALEIATKVQEVIAAEPPRPLLYIDANSIAPSTAHQIGQVFSKSTVDFVDVAIHGLASRLHQQGTIFASGPRAEVIANLFGEVVRVKLLGSEPGQASLQKMLLGSMSKGLIGLFLQAALVAQESGLANQFLEDLRHYYPDVCAFVERSLPTYPQHAYRRSEEMGEWENSLSNLHFRTTMASEIRRLFCRLAESNLSVRCAQHSGKMELTQLLELMSCDNPLRDQSTALQSQSLR